MQTPDSTNGILETLINPREVWADVQPIGPMTFWGSMQTETPVTHRITLRWVGYIDNTWVVIRTSAPPTQQPAPQTDQGYGQQRLEVFRVRRVLEIDGRKRFTGLDCELEQTS